MEVVPLDTGDAVGRLVADAVEAVVRARPGAVLGLATGSSPLPAYRELLSRHRAGCGPSYAAVTAFLLDEYVGLPWLSRIPVLGYLFRQTTESFDKTELFIMLTPHVVANPQEGRMQTEQFRQRLDWLEKAIQERANGEKPWYRP